MSSKRWSEDPAFCEVATHAAILDMMRSRLGSRFEVSHKRALDTGEGCLRIVSEKSNTNSLARYHLPENYERIARLARTIASTDGRHREGAQEA